MSLTVRVYDPPMCCSSGVCGPSVDPALVRFASDLEWLSVQGIPVERFNLAQTPGAFAADPAVTRLLEEKGDGALPAILVGEDVKSSGRYPDRAEMAHWLGLEPPQPSLVTEAVAELVAIGASIASNCEPCFRFHFDKARKLGVSKEDMLRAVDVAQAVKETPARAVLELAERYLVGGKVPVADPPESKEEGTGCCGATQVVSLRSDKGCC